MAEDEVAEADEGVADDAGVDAAARPLVPLVADADRAWPVVGTLWK